MSGSGTIPGLPTSPVSSQQIWERKIDLRITTMQAEMNENFGKMVTQILMQILGH